MVLRVPTVNPRLANITAPQLPKINVLGALQQGMARGDRSRELRAQEQLQSTLQDQGPAALGGDVDALNEIRMLGEDGFNMADQIQKVLNSQDSKKVLEAQKKIEKHGLFLASILKLEPPEQKRKLFDESHKLMSAGDRKAATEFLHISQLKDDLDIQGEVESALVIASAGNKYLQGFVPQTGARTGLASAKTEIFKNGSTIQGLPSGQVDVRNPAGQIVTGDERVKVLEAAQQSGIVGAADKAAAIKDAERKALADTAGDVISSEKSAIRRQKAIDDAFETGEGIAVLNRAIDLLGSVKTGGFEQARLRAAQIFGIEGGDEGELSNLMGKAVLGQLKDIFGSAFTVGEGDRLERMEAGFGKSAKANRRLLDNALALTKRSVKRGIRAAKRAGQDEEAADLQELLDATLETPATQKSLPQGITEDDITETMSANNMTREEVLKRLNQ